MPNPFLQPQQTNLQQAYNMFIQSKNPMELFKNMAKQNPQLNSVIQMLNSGSDPQQLFYSLCQQRGINPQQFLKLITG